VKRNLYRQRNYAQTQGAPNTRNPWTEAEDKQVLAREVTDRELSAKLGRSVQAIQIRRSRIGGSK
jgi:hypothetical protein